MPLASTPWQWQGQIGATDGSFAQYVGPRELPAAAGPCAIAEPRPGRRYDPNGSRGLSGWATFVVAATSLQSGLPMKSGPPAPRPTLPAPKPWPAVAGCGQSLRVQLLRPSRWQRGQGRPKGQR
jgi:hypothetical protein